MDYYTALYKPFLKGSKEGSIYNSERKQVGTISELGFVYDLKRILLGYVTSYGMIRNTQQECIGHTSQKGYVMDKYGKDLCFIDKRGIVINKRKEIIGYIEDIEYNGFLSSLRCEAAAFFLVYLEEGWRGISSRELKEGVKDLDATDES